MIVKQVLSRRALEFFFDSDLPAKEKKERKKREGRIAFSLRLLA